MSELPPGWEWATLGDVCELNPPDPPLSETDPFIPMAAVEVGKRYPASTEERGRRSGARGRSNDLFFARITPCLENGKVCLIPPDMGPTGGSTEFIVVRPPLNIRPEYLYFWSQEPSVRESAKAAMSGTTGRMRLAPGGLAGIPFPLAPLAEQERIVAAIEEAFSKLDAGEASLRSAQQRLKRLRAAVLAEMLGDNDQWTACRLRDVSEEVKNGIFVSRPSATPPGIPILRIGAVRPLALDLEDVRFASVDLADPAVGRAVLEAGDLLFTRYNGNPEYVGACAAVPHTSSPVLHPDKLIRVRLDRSVADPTFVELAVSTGSARAHIRRSVKTTAGQAGLSGSDLKATPLRLPTLEDQRAIARAVRDQLELYGRLEWAVVDSQSRSATLRRSILKAAFEGRLVPQDPSDEPASVLLERIREERAAAAPVKRGRSRKVSS